MSPSRLRRKPPRLIARLIPFTAFGLRVFGACFIGVPADDPVRIAVAPVVDWVNGGAHHSVAVEAGYDLGHAGGGSREPHQPAVNRTSVWSVGTGARLIQMVGAKKLFHRGGRPTLIFR